MNRRVSRRSFVQSTFIGMTGAAWTSSNDFMSTTFGRSEYLEPEKKRSANDRIQLGFIGIGTMGRGHLGGFLGNNRTQVVAVCDVVQERLQAGKKQVEDRYSKGKKGTYNGCQTFTDFRELLEKGKVDAVVIATPDHWHAIPCILAARAKKHIYCENKTTRYPRAHTSCNAPKRGQHKA